MTEYPRIVEKTVNYGGEIKQYTVEYIGKNGNVVAEPYFELKAAAEKRLMEKQIEKSHEKQTPIVAK